MDQNEKSLFLICEDIRTNKKSKLPWTIKEVTIGIKTVFKMIEKSSYNRPNRLKRSEDK